MKTSKKGYKITVWQVGNTHKMTLCSSVSSDGKSKETWSSKAIAVKHADAFLARFSESNWQFTIEMVVL